MMRKFALAVALATGTLFAGFAVPAHAAAVPGVASSTQSGSFVPGKAGVNKDVVQVRKWRRGGWRRGWGRGGPRWGYRRWKRRNHYGALVGGIVLGTIIAAAATNYRRPPRDDLCWYWANRHRTHGYWDYCY